MKEVYKAILDEPTHLGTITILEPRMFWFPRKKTIDLNLTGATAATMYKIVSVIEGLESDVKSESEELAMYNVITTNTPAMIEIIALALHNQPTPPPAYLKEELEKLPWRQLKGYMYEVYRRLGVEDFFECLASIRSLNVHKSDIPETTAPGE